MLPYSRTVSRLPARTVILVSCIALACRVASAQQSIPLFVPPDSDIAAGMVVDINDLRGGGLRVAESTAPGRGDEKTTLYIRTSSNREHIIESLDVDWQAGVLLAKVAKGGINLRKESTVSGSSAQLVCEVVRTIGPISAQQPTPEELSKHGQQWTHFVVSEKRVQRIKVVMDISLDIVDRESLLKLSAGFAGVTTEAKRTLNSKSSGRTINLTIEAEGASVSADAMGVPIPAEGGDVVAAMQQVAFNAIKASSPEQAHPYRIVLKPLKKGGSSIDLDDAARLPYREIAIEFCDALARGDEYYADLRSKRFSDPAFEDLWLTSRTEECQRIVPFLKSGLQSDPSAPAASEQGDTIKSIGQRVRQFANQIPRKEFDVARSTEVRCSNLEGTEEVIKLPPLPARAVACQAAELLLSSPDGVLVREWTAKRDGKWLAANIDWCGHKCSGWGDRTDRIGMQTMAGSAALAKISVSWRSGRSSALAMAGDGAAKPLTNGIAILVGEVGRGNAATKRDLVVTMPSPSFFDTDPKLLQVDAFKDGVLKFSDHNPPGTGDCFKTVLARIAGERLPLVECSFAAVVEIPYYQWSSASLKARSVVR